MFSTNRSFDGAVDVPPEGCDYRIFRVFAFLSEMAVDTMLFNWYTEYLTGRGTVDIFSFCEYLGASGLTGKVIYRDGPAIHRDSEEQYLKFFRLSVLVGIALGNIHVAVSLLVD